MFFLNEKLIAAFLSILSFFISFFVSLMWHVDLRTALFRGTICGFVFLCAGLFFGTVIKNLIVEAFITQETEEEGEEKEKGKEKSKIKINEEEKEEEEEYGGPPTNVPPTR